MRRGFTLLEVLVALGLIGLLSALIVSGLHISRARANSARCLNHLRSLGVAINLYLADHQMILPDIEAGRADRNEEVPVIDNTLDSYMDSNAAFTCPADRSIAKKSGTSYYWNSAIRGQNIANLHLFWLSDPSRIPLLVDKEGWHNHVENKVNHLFADGHVTNELRLIAE